MDFKLFDYADISTDYLEESDLERLPTVPGHLAETDDGSGSILYLPGADIEGETESYIEQVRKHGMSEQFVTIIRELCRQEIAYVRFDADGSGIDGLEPLLASSKEH